MKKFVAVVSLSFLLLAGIATAQTPLTETADDNALSFISKASCIALNTNKGNLDGYLGVFVDRKNWQSLLKDKDIGPFLRLKKQASNCSAVLLISSDKKKKIFCVYFDCKVPMELVFAKGG